MHSYFHYFKKFLLNFWKLLCTSSFHYFTGKCTKMFSGLGNRHFLKVKITRKSSWVNARGIPPHPDLVGGVPCRGYPTWLPPQPPGRVTPLSWPGLGGVPYLDTTPAGYPPAGYLPLWQVPPWARYPPGRVPPPQLDLAGYPPPRWLPHGILGNVAKHYGIWVPPCGQTDGRTDACQNITFPSYYVAGGKKSECLVLPNNGRIVHDIAKIHVQAKQMYVFRWLILLSIWKKKGKGV